VRVRAIEWQPEQGVGWSYLPGAQKYIGFFSAQSDAVDGQIESPAALREALPGACNFERDGADTLRVVFGEVGATDAGPLAQWLTAIFPDLLGAHVLARELCRRSLGMIWAGIPGRERSLHCVHVEVPERSEAEGEIKWMAGTICPIENVLIVLWHQSEGASYDRSVRIDGAVRKGGYGGVLELSVAELANRYVLEVVEVLSDEAIFGARAVDRWESDLFESASREGVIPDLAPLGRLRASATALRARLDGLEVQVMGRRYRSVWSTSAGDVIDPAVGGEIASARERVFQLRSDVSDAFIAANTVAIGAQLALSQRQQAQVDRLQAVVTRLTAFLLVPGLVATVFGANVALPGSSGTARLLFMLAAMVVGAILTLLVLRSLSRR